MILGNDGHAKNYSILIGSRGIIRLVPLYDLASALPYNDMDFQKLKLAMRIGKDYKLRDIGARQWLQLASRVCFDPKKFLQIMSRFAVTTPQEVFIVRDQMKENGLSHDAIDRLYDRLQRRCVSCFESIQHKLNQSTTH